MTTQQRVVVGVFPIMRLAQQAVEELHAAGFGQQDVGLAADHVFVTQTQTGLPDDHNNADAGALGGMLAGAGVGSLWSLGVAAEILPELAPLIACGGLASASVSVIAGATAGGLIGGLLRWGIPQDEAQKYVHHLHAGNTLVTVEPRDRYDEACAILRSNGAQLELPTVPHS